MTPSKPFLCALFLALLHLGFSLWINPPGYLTFDSGTYHFMAKTFAETGGFEVWNGYEEFPTDALKVAQLKVHDDHLAAQYPEVLTLATWPFYKAFGYHGFFIFHSLAFLGINWLLFFLATTLFGSRRIAWLSMVVYSFGTFAWEYSQSSYPHLSSTFLVLAAYTCLAKALPWKRDCVGGDAAHGDTFLDDTGHDEARHTLLWGLAAGLAVGLAPGMRLDAAFAIPGLAVPLLLLRPLRWRLALATGAGLLPGLLLLASINQLKFDVFSPFTYGESRRHFYTGDWRWYLPMFGLMIAGALFLMIFSRLSPGARRRLWMASGVAVVLAALAVPGRAWAFLAQLVDGTWQLVVDLRIRDLDIVEPALQRSPSGAMIYIGGVKKSLLQSCPYLLLLVFPFLDARKSLHQLARLAFLLLVPATFTLFYGYLAWHGSIALNMRYLNPILPFTSLLAAAFLAPLLDDISPRLLALAGTTFGLILLLIFKFHDFSLPEQEMWFLTAPLGIAVGLLALELLRRSRLLPNLGRGLTVASVVFAIAWSGALTLGRDYPASAEVRGTNLAMGRAFAPHLSDDILVISDFPDFTWHVLDQHDKVRVAFFGNNHAELEALAKFHLAAGRQVFMAGTVFGARRGGQEGGFLRAFQVQVIDTWQGNGLPGVVLLRLNPAATTPLMLSSPPAS